MKIGSIDNKLKMQEQELKEPKQYFTGENKKEIFQSGEKENTSPSGWQEPRGGEASLKLSSEWQADAETILQTMGFSSAGNFPSRRHYSLFA